MDGRGDVAARLSAALAEIEDQFLWNPEASLATAIRIEDEALALDDEPLLFRARLAQANMLMRNGDVAAAARRIWQIHQWATDNGDNVVLARTHLVWAAIHRHLGDAAQCLEHSVLAVELLDDQATPHMQVWHRAKLADALGLAGSMEAARQRYAQTEELAIDKRVGFFVNHDLALYEVPVHADIPHQDVVFLDETDPQSSPMKAKGVAELGICGVAAAVANAIYNATGVRVRDYPITLDKLLDGLPAAV